MSGVVSTPPKSLTTASIGAHAARGPARRSARPRAALHPPAEERAVQASAGRGRASCRSGPRPRRAAGSPPRRRRARGRRRAGGRRRRRWSTAAGRATAVARGGVRLRVAVEDRRGDLLVVVVRRARRADRGERHREVVVEPRARRVRASAIRSQSGAPHECPRWPRRVDRDRAAPPTRRAPGHADGLVEARHAAGPGRPGRRGRAPRSRRRRAGRGRGSRRRRRSAAARRAAARRPRCRARRPRRRPTPSASPASTPPSARTATGSPRWKRIARPLAPFVGQAEARDAVEVGALVAERDRDRVGEPVARPRARGVVLPGARSRQPAAGRPRSRCPRRRAAAGPAAPPPGRAAAGAPPRPARRSALTTMPRQERAARRARADERARRRQQQDDPEDVADEAGRQQQRAAEDHERAVEDLAVRDRGPRRAPR